MTNKKAKGKRAKTRRKLRAPGTRKTVNQLVRGFDEGEAVQICIDSSIHSGIPAPKYQGYSGAIVGKRGSAFEVAVNEGSFSCKLVVHPAHLKSLKGAKS